MTRSRPGTGYPRTEHALSPRQSHGWSRRIFPGTSDIVGRYADKAAGVGLKMCLAVLANTWTRKRGLTRSSLLSLVANSSKTRMKPAPMVFRFFSGSLTPCQPHQRLFNVSTGWQLEDWTNDMWIVISQKAVSREAHLELGEHAGGVVDHGDRQVQVVPEGLHHPLPLLQTQNCPYRAIPSAASILNSVTSPAGLSCALVLTPCRI